MESYGSLYSTWKAEFGFPPLSLLVNLPDATAAHQFLWLSVTLSHFKHSHISTHTAMRILPRAPDRFPYWSPTRSSESPGDGEHGLTREWRMKTECWKTQAAGGKSIRVEDVFPWNQIVHIFIFAHRPTPTGHQYAKPKACCVCLLFATREGTESNSFQ